MDLAFTFVLAEAMFSLIRRISYGVIPRPDRPWEEDGECYNHNESLGRGQTPVVVSVVPADHAMGRVSDHIFPLTPVVTTLHRHYTPFLDLYPSKSPGGLNSPLRLKLAFSVYQRLPMPLPGGGNAA